MMKIAKLSINICKASFPVETPVTRQARAIMKNAPAARLNRTAEKPVTKIPTHCNHYRHCQQFEE